MRALLASFAPFVIQQSPQPFDPENCCQSQRVTFPFTRPYSSDLADALRLAFHEIVESTDVFVPSSDDCFHVPMMGNAKVSFLASDFSPSAFVLTVDDATEDDFGWICSRFFECKSSLVGVDTNELETVVLDHFTNQMLNSPGMDASTAMLAGSSEIASMFADSTLLHDLKNKGYTIIDNAPFTTARSRELLSKHLVKKSTQDDCIRTDRVSFLDRHDALSCMLEHQWDILMGIASYLNDQLDFEEWPHSPRLPALLDKPLTNPTHIQAAEYGEHDFYIPHRDNTLIQGKDNVRANLRYYTCILYLNDDWKACDGGALRLYPESQNVANVHEAKNMEFVDIYPVNGRLLVFNSMLVHSVEKVTQSKKARQALTIWINRPDDSITKVNSKRLAESKVGSP